MEEIRKVCWLHFEDRKLLCVRRPGARQFYIPGGRAVDGEDDFDVLRREIADQLGVDLDPSTARRAMAVSAPSDEDETVLVTIKAYRAPHRGELLVQGDTAELRYLGSAEADLTSTLTRLFMLRLETAHVIE